MQIQPEQWLFIRRGEKWLQAYLPDHRRGYAGDNTIVTIGFTAAVSGLIAIFQ